MWIASNDIEVVVDWFYRESKAQFLGLFVAGDAGLGGFLDSVLEKRDVLDGLLGSAIDLVLLSPEHRPVGSSAVRRITKLRKWDVDRKKDLTTATEMSAQEIAKALEVDEDKLPGLVILGRRSRRGNSRPKLVLPLRSVEDSSFLIDFLPVFRRSLDTMRAFSQTAPKTRDWFEAIEHNVHHLQQREADARRQEQRIAANLDALSSSLAARGLVLPTPDERLAAAGSIPDLRRIVSEQLRDTDASTLDGILAQPELKAILKRLGHAQVARRTARAGIAKLQRATPSTDELSKMRTVIELTQADVSSLESLIEKHSRRPNGSIPAEVLFELVGLTEKFRTTVDSFQRSHPA